MSQPSLGVVSQSRKPAERRLPIHPRHVEEIGAELRGRIYLERGYGTRFGVPDDHLAPLVAGLRTREQLVDECDVILLPKPQPADLEPMREGQVLWGWPHCVQDAQITQLAIERRLTLIAFEAMQEWSAEGAFQRHVFSGNNELAGYASVLHALQLLGTTGEYGRRLRAAVLGRGTTARGAVKALNALGVRDVSVLVRAEAPGSADPIPDVQLVSLTNDPDDPARIVTAGDRAAESVGALLGRRDIVVNCVLQDPDEPVVFVTDEELSGFAPGSLIVDVSCDEGMGFSWARPTSFAEPMFEVGDRVHYYGVDHSPSYFWDSATWEISRAVLAHLPTVLGPAAWDADPTVSRAIEIRDGVIQNPAILSYQHRSADYPHAVEG